MSRFISCAQLSSGKTLPGSLGCGSPCDPWSRSTTFMDVLKAQCFFFFFCKICDFTSRLVSVMFAVLIRRI